MQTCSQFYHIFSTLRSIHHSQPHSCLPLVACKQAKILQASHMLQGLVNFLIEKSLVRVAYHIFPCKITPQDYFVKCLPIIYLQHQARNQCKAQKNQSLNLLQNLQAVLNWIWFWFLNLLPLKETFSDTCWKSCMKMYWYVVHWPNWEESLDMEITKM